MSQDKLLILKALSDASRLKILMILRDSDCYPELLALKLGLTPATVIFHLKKLQQAGLIQCSRVRKYQFYSLNRDLMDQSLLNMIEPERRDDTNDDRYYAQVIGHFFENGRLKTIPVQIKKRRIVLEYIVSNMEPDKEYTEGQLIDFLKQYHDDYCTIRRDLIGWEYITENNGIYQRTWR